LVTRDLVLNMGEFGRQALERFVRDRNRSPSAATRTASLYYLADRDADRPSWPVPRFARRRATDGDSAAMDVRIDDATWDVLVEEAERQGVDVEQLASHAILYFLADLDSGRLAGRLDEVLD
jgi:hypothetical protein